MVLPQAINLFEFPESDTPAFLASKKSRTYSGYHTKLPYQFDYLGVWGFGLR